MHKNVVWQAFLAIVFAVTLWHSVVALYSYYSYSQLKVQTRLTAINWEIEEESEEYYLLKAVYRFQFKGNSYPGNTAWADEPYRNRWAAEQAAKEFSEQKWKVWFNPNDPHHSSLQKKFPFKQCISAIFLWGLLLYFLWLGFYVTRFKS